MPSDMAHVGALAVLPCKRQDLDTIVPLTYHRAIMPEALARIRASLQQQLVYRVE